MTMNSGKSAEKIYPGCLYAKSLLPDDPPGTEFQWHFLHRDIKPFLSKIDALRTSFFWESGNVSDHVPVVIDMPISSGFSLVVRFSDAGKDKFGREGTIRLEALLVPKAEVPSLINGVFSAIPQKESEVFLVRAPENPTVLLPQGSVGVFGKPGSFKLKNVGIETRASTTTTQDARLTNDFHAANRRKLLRAYLTAVVAGLVAVASILTAVRLAGVPHESKEELQKTRRKMMELETNMAKLKDDMTVQTKSFNDFCKQLSELVNQAPTFSEHRQ